MWKCDAKQVDKTWGRCSNIGHPVWHSEYFPPFLSFIFYNLLSYPARGKIETFNSYLQWEIKNELIKHHVKESVTMCGKITFTHRSKKLSLKYISFDSFLLLTVREWKIKRSQVGHEFLDFLKNACLLHENGIRENTTVIVSYTQKGLCIHFSLTSNFFWRTLGIRMGMNDFHWCSRWSLIK